MPSHHPTRGTRNRYAWVPLVATAAIATAGVIAWIWSESHDYDDENAERGVGWGHADEHERGRGRSRGRSEKEARERGIRLVDRESQRRGGDSSSSSGDSSNSSTSSGEDTSSGESSGEGTSSESEQGGNAQEEPSSKNNSFMSSASRRLAAGVNSIGSLMGILKEEDVDFGDHERWGRDEAEARAAVRGGDRGIFPEGSGGGDAGEGLSQARAPAETTRPAAAAAAAPRQKLKMGRKKKVAIVVSDQDVIRTIDGHYMSFLSTLSRDIDPESANIVVLIHAPGLRLAKDLSSNFPGASNQQQHQEQEAEQSNTRPETLSNASSFANISPPNEAERPDDAGTGNSTSFEQATGNPSTSLGVHAPVDRYDFSGTNGTPKELYHEALSLTAENQVLFFSTTRGHINILRSIAPDVVYMQESMTGDNGEGVRQLVGWCANVVVVPDAEEEDRGGKYYREEAGVAGRGRRIEIVESAFVDGDWRRRVMGLKE